MISTIWHLKSIYNNYRCTSASNDIDRTIYLGRYQSKLFKSFARGFYESVNIITNVPRLELKSLQFLKKYSTSFNFVLWDTSFTYLKFKISTRWLLPNYYLLQVFTDARKCYNFFYFNIIHSHISRYLPNTIDFRIYLLKVYFKINAYTSKIPIQYK